MADEDVQLVLGEASVLVGDVLGVQHLDGGR